MNTSFVDNMLITPTPATNSTSNVHDPRNAIAEEQLQLSHGAPSIRGTDYAHAQQEDSVAAERLRGGCVGLIICGHADASDTIRCTGPVYRYVLLHCLLKFP